MSQKGKNATDPSSFGFGEGVQTQWKNHFENLLNLVSLKEAESEDLGEGSSITLAEMLKGVKKLNKCQVWM